ncbi:MAG: nitroreductase family protein [Moorellales bacterium]
MEDLIRLVRNRRSVRSFSSLPVPTELIITLLEAARWAPSAGNLQPWHFYAVRAPETKYALARAAAQIFVAEAPVVIAVCALPEQSASIYGERGRHLYCLQDTAAATQNLLLAATAAGLSSCWVGAFDEEEVRRVLGLGPEVRPVALVPLGYGREKPRPVARVPLEAVVRLID